MEYIQYMHQHGIEATAAAVSGNGMDFLTGRVSYLFSLVGPTVAVHTACSSSLVATYLSIQDMKASHVMSSTVSGVFSILLSGTMAGIAQLNALSPEGRCKTFDISANGYGRGEGAVTFALSGNESTRQSFCSVKGIKINHTGRSSGLTAPNGPSQAALIQKTMRKSGVAPNEIVSLSVHGTGTSLGDPIELGGIKTSFLTSIKKSTCKNLFLISSKSCLGHTEGAAGLSGSIFGIGSIASLLSPECLHLRTLNPFVSSLITDESICSVDTLRISRVKSPLITTAETHKLGTATSSFGMSGVNAHAVFQVALNFNFAKATLEFQRNRRWVLPEYKTLINRCIASQVGGIVFSISLSKAPELQDHVVDGHIIVPATAIMEVFSSTVEILSPTYRDNLEIMQKDLVISSSLFLNAANVICHAHPNQGQLSMQSGRQVFSKASFRILNKSQISHLDQHIDIVYRYTSKFPQTGPMKDFWADTIGRVNIGELGSVLSRKERCYTLNPVKADACLHCLTSLTASKLPLGVPDAFSRVVYEQDEASLGCRSRLTVYPLTADRFSLESDLVELHDIHIRQIRRDSKDQNVEVLSEIFYETHHCICSVAKKSSANPFDILKVPESYLDSASILQYVLETISGNIETLQLKLKLASSTTIAPCRMKASGETASALGMMRTIAFERRDFDIQTTLYGYLESQTVNLNFPIDKRAESSVHASTVAEPKIRHTMRQPLPSNWHLKPIGDGSIDNIRMVHRKTHYEHENSVDVRIHSVGLNFRDLLNVIGMYPGKPQPLGSDFSGTILACKGQASFKLGDNVFGFIPGCIGDIACNVDTRMMVKMPRNTTFEEACSFPTVYATAICSLSDCKANETILLHSASGGFGSAVIRVAKALGCKIVATSGSPAKRSYLRSTGLRQIFDSRTLQFVSPETVLPDCVVNALTSPGMIAASLSTLKIGGRFVEVGKRGILCPKRSAQERSDVLLDTIAIDYMHPEVLGSFLLQVSNFVALGKITPPDTCDYSIYEAKTAFRTYSRSHHIGKIILSNHIKSNLDCRFAQDGRWIISGGGGTLGLLSASWLCGLGVKYMSLQSRKMTTIRSLSHSDCLILGQSLDVSTAEGINYIGSQVSAREMPEPPVTNIIHAAGLIEDAIYIHQSLSKLRSVDAPKSGLICTRSRHRMTNMSVERCIMFSSISSILGSSGQANYSSSNGRLDGISAEFHSSGMNSLAIQWGAWDAGMAENEMVRQKAQKVGLILMRSEHAISSLEVALRSMNSNLLSSTVAIFDIHWDSLLHYLGDIPSILSDVISSHNQIMKGYSHGKSYADHFSAEDVLPEVLKIVESVTGTWVEESEPLMQSGVDSVGIIELQNALKTHFGVSLTPTVLFDYPTAYEIANHIVSIIQDDMDNEQIFQVRSQLNDYQQEEERVFMILAKGEKQLVQSSEDDFVSCKFASSCFLVQ